MDNGQNFKKFSGLARKTNFVILKEKYIGSLLEKKFHKNLYGKVGQ
jgi:hypothetical protein